MTAPVTLPRSRSELALRVLSAAILIPFALFVVYQGGVWLAVGAAAFAGIMGYEWSRMSGQGPVWGPVIALAAVNLSYAFCSVAMVSAALGVIALAFGALHWRNGPLAAFGMIYAGGLPFALQMLRAGGPWDGQAAALILMAMVWASDSGAYFAGRGFGGPALSSDSPNKTWSGAIGAVICAMLAGLIAARLMEADRVVWAAFGAGLSIVAQLGDLAESQIKRRFDVKDASNVVPGHGGVMDRVDGLGAVCVVAVAVFLAFPAMVRLLGFAQ